MKGPHIEIQNGKRSSLKTAKFVLTNIGSDAGPNRALQSNSIPEAQACSVKAPFRLWMMDMLSGPLIYFSTKIPTVLV